MAKAMHKKKFSLLSIDKPPNKKKLREWRKANFLERVIPLLLKHMAELLAILPLHREAAEPDAALHAAGAWIPITGGGALLAYC